MALRMAQPWPHPKTGVFWFRRVVPADLRKLVGKTEERLTLRTKNAAEARVRYAQASAQVEARWASLRRGSESPIEADTPAATVQAQDSCTDPDEGTRSLTEREAHALASEAHDVWVEWHADEPSQQFTWHPRLYRFLWTRTLPTKLSGDGETMKLDDVVLKSMRRLCFIQADNCLAHHGLLVDEYSRVKLAKALGAAFQRASKTVNRLAEGEILYEQVHAARRDSHASRSVPQGAATGRSDNRSRVASTLSLMGLFEAWWQEAQAAGRKPSTHESYQNTVRNLVSFLDHDDAMQVTPEDIVAFKDYRLNTPSARTGRVPSPKTVKDSDLAALKTLFGWAVMNRKLPMNPAAGLTIKVGRKAQVRPKGFTEAEARAILAAALAYEASPRELRCTAEAKRWIPWLCAFSGARVGEIAQLRRQDIRQEGDFWVIRVTPEAGTVKTNQARDIVLHPQLVELGFTRFIEASVEGPLFLVPAIDGDVLGPLAGLLNRMREFVRPIVPDINVQPNHGWRHLFTTMCIDAEIEARVYNAIQGHAGRTVADHYGDVTLKAKAAAINKLSPFRIEV